MFQARIVGVDPENDPALLQFDPGDADLPAVKLGTSSNLQTGQRVIALGNPFGLDRTLTTGVISGLRRPIVNEDGFLMHNLIQTDASINPANSGGALLNSNGELIGVNTMILSPSGGAVGVGFAVPVDTAKRVVPQLVAHGRVSRGWIDIVPVPIHPALSRQANLPVRRGILVSEVVPNGDAVEAGILGGRKGSFIVSGRTTVHLGGDIIVRINDVPVRTFSDYFGALEGTVPGDEAQLRIIQSSRALSITVRLSERPKKYRW